MNNPVVDLIDVIAHIRHALRKAGAQSRYVDEVSVLCRDWHALGHAIVVAGLSTLDTTGNAVYVGRWTFDLTDELTVAQGECRVVASRNQEGAQ